MMIRRRRAWRRTKARAGILLLLALALVIPLTVQAVSPPGSDDGGFGTPSAKRPLRRRGNRRRCLSGLGGIYFINTIMKYKPTQGEMSNQ